MGRRSGVAPQVGSVMCWYTRRVRGHSTTAGMMFAGVLSLACGEPDRTSGPPDERPGVDALTEEPTAPPATRFALAPQIFCGEDAREAACTFRGTVRDVEPAEVVPRFGMASPPSRVRATRIDLDPDEQVTCARLAAPTGVHAAEPLATRTIFVALPEGAPGLALAPGDRVCGSGERYSLGYDPGYAGVLHTSGDLALAFSPAVPRGPSPLPGWAFATLGRRRAYLTEEDVWRTLHDVRVSHGGAAEEIVADEVAVVELGGAHWVTARAYTNEGRLPPWQGWMGRAGYGFVIVRLATERASPGEPTGGSGDG